MQGEGLLERDLQVYLPPGDGPYPVLYMQDGQNLFDPDGAFGSWDMQGAVAEVGGDLIVVGIVGSADRMEDYAHTGDYLEDLGSVEAKGALYAAFVVERVKPLIETRYPTGAIAGVMGSSMGGLISLYIAHLYPETFAFAGSLSGSLGWGRLSLDGPVMQELYEPEGVRDFVIYVDSGGSDGGDGCTDEDQDGFFEDDPNSSDFYCSTRQFADAMAALGYTWNTNLYHWHEPGAPHNETAWAARVAGPLGIFAGLGR